MTIFLCIGLLTAVNTWAQGGQEPRLWYDHPAKAWEEALPLGNGRLGAMVWGDVDEELIQLNEGTLWSGLPVPASVNPEAKQYLPQVREALAAKDYARANELCKRMQGYFSQSYMPMGDLHIRYRYPRWLDERPPGNDVSHYRRELSLRDGVLTESYRKMGEPFERRMYVSVPDQAMVVELTGFDMSIDISLSSQLRPTFETRGENVLVMRGKAPSRVDPNYYNKQGRESVDWGTTPETFGMRWQTDVGVKQKGGRVWADEKGLHVQGALSITLYITAATSFNGCDRHPYLDGKDEAALADGALQRVMAKDVTQVEIAHTKVFHSFFDRVRLSLASSEAERDTIPTDVRLKQYSEGVCDTGLETLLFDYGRYLLISSSQPGGVPANLQGIWNPHMRPAWSSNYTTNINVQMNYWLAEPCNLPELHEPLLDWIQTLPKHGRNTAQEFYGMRGWVEHHNSDIWGMTYPVGNVGDGDPLWANWYMGGAWLCQHLWEHYAFTLDKKYLERVYPTMREAALFCMDWLIEKKTEDGQTYLITAPSTSPENRFRYNSRTYAVTEGSTMDLAIIRDLFNNVIAASEVLDTDKELRQEIEQKRARLLPFKVSPRTGRLQEWMDDFDDNEPHHRHISHLFALHPSNQISPITTPELARAADRTFELRGDDGTGWSMAWKMNFAARLLDGNHAYKMLRQALRYVDPKNPRHGGTFPNLFDAHPPFQIDGNFGATAGVCEMLLQNHLGEIHLLPALPDAWPTGDVRGLKARGNFIVDMKWEDGVLTEACITSLAGQMCRLRTNIPIFVRGAKTVQTMRDGLYYITEFNTKKGQTYSIVGTNPQRLDYDASWRLVWHDEFDGTGPLDSLTWQSERGFVRNEEYQWYQPQNAYRKDGVLVLEGRLDSIPNPQFRGGDEDDDEVSPTTRGGRWRQRRPYARYSSGSVNTRKSYSFQYGRMEVRARIPAVCGAWPAIWTLGTKMGCPSCGECDVMEYYRFNDRPIILANAAWGDDQRGHAVWNTKRIPYEHFLEKDPDWGNKFHTWTMDWTEDYIRLYLDGELLNDVDLTKTVNGSQGNYANPFHQPHYILLDLAIGGTNGGWPDDASFPMLYEIDYVRVYQK